jgi:hypothetical protein
MLVPSQGRRSVARYRLHAPPDLGVLGPMRSPSASVNVLERLAATCQLQSNAKPLNVDANAVP